MSESENNNIRDICDIYKELPDYLKGKIDGYAEAIKERNTGKQSTTNMDE